MSEYITEYAEYMTLGEVAIEKREPIVRCRDCRHFKKGEEEPPVDWCCYFHDEVTPLGFCAWGERGEA